MNSDLIAIASFGVFFFLYLLITQRIYSSKYSFVIILSSLLFCILLFLFLRYKYDKPKQAYLVLLVFHYFFLLLVIKYSYHKCNSLFIRKKWIANSFSNKDFTYVLDSEEGSSWDEKRSAKPSWLDYIFSYGLLFGPMLFTWLTIDLFE
jgi:hypothetical protein